MSQKEIDDIRPSLYLAARQYLWVLDELHYATLKSHQRYGYWQDCTDDELATIVEPWLRRAAKSKKAAARARTAVRWYEDVVGPLGFIVPRVILTYESYKRDGITFTGK